MVIPRFLLDTDALSEPLRPRPDEAFLARFREHADSLAIAATTWQEALYGLGRLPDGARKQRIREYLHEVVLATIPVLPYDDPAARWHAERRVRLEAYGKKVAFADGQIAAIASVNGCELVTFDTRHFAAFDGLVVTTWKSRARDRDE